VRSDPAVPGVFSCDNTDSFFVESTEARPAMSVMASPVLRALPVREILEPIARRVIASVPPRARLERDVSRSYVAVSPPPAPESSDDH
jgi:hypothetical protein